MILCFHPVDELAQCNITRKKTFCASERKGVRYVRQLENILGLERERGSGCVVGFLLMKHFELGHEYVTMSMLCLGENYCKEKSTVRIIINHRLKASGPLLHKISKLLLPHVYLTKTLCGSGHTLKQSLFQKKGRKK